MSTLALNRSYELQMPSSFVDIDRDEMEYVNGGSLTVAGVVGIITGAMAITGGVYAAGIAAGERVYYSGYPNSKYQKDKWKIRSGVILALGPAIGGTIMLGFENKYYSLVTGR